MLGLGEHCPSLPSITTPDPNLGEVKTRIRAQKRFELQKDFQNETSLYWRKPEIVF